MNAKELLTEPIGFLVATHNAHHLGQVILLRQMLGAWPPPAGSWTCGPL